MKKYILLAFLTFSLSSHAQLGDLLKSNKKLDLYKEEKLDFPQYKNHIGEILFSNDEFERELPESKYIKTYKLGDPLHIRAFMANSPFNSMFLQLQAGGKSIREINVEKKSFESLAAIQFRLYFDGKYVGDTNLNYPFVKSDLMSLPTHRAELNDNTKEDWFGEDMYRELLEKKDLLIPGTHKLKIELVVDKNNGFGADFKYTPLAVGEIDMIVPETKASEETCFPYKALSDAAMENEVMKAVKKSRPNAFKVILNSREKVVRNEYGLIASKTFYATIVSKTPEKIWYDQFLMEKEYQGSGYSDVYISRDMENALLPKNFYVSKECLKFLK
jgi:hypothetical protein